MCMCQQRVVLSQQPRQSQPQQTSVPLRRRFLSRTCARSWSSHVPVILLSFFSHSLTGNAVDAEVPAEPAAQPFQPAHRGLFDTHVSFLQPPGLQDDIGCLVGPRHQFIGMDRTGWKGWSWSLQNRAGESLSWKAERSHCPSLHGACGVASWGWCNHAWNHSRWFLYSYPSCCGSTGHFGNGAFEMNSAAMHGARRLVTTALKGQKGLKPPTRVPLDLEV